MAFSPKHQGASGPQYWVFQDDKGNPISLAGATLTWYLYNPKTNSAVAGTGTWTITNPAQGQATYNMTATDTSVPGTYQLTVNYNIPGVVNDFTDFQQFVITPLSIQQQ